MKKEMMKKAFAEKVVRLAVQGAKMPNQICVFLVGKPKDNCNLTSDDYTALAAFMKRSQS